MPMLIVSQEPSKQLASSVDTGNDPVTVFLSFVPKGGQNEIVWIIGGARTYSCAKHVANQGGPGACSPRKMFDFGPLIRQNLVESGTVFAQQIYVSLKLLYC